MNISLLPGESLGQRYLRCLHYPQRLSGESKEVYQRRRADSKAYVKLAIRGEIPR